MTVTRKKKRRIRNEQGTLSCCQEDYSTAWQVSLVTEGLGLQSTRLAAKAATDYDTWTFKEEQNQRPDWLAVGGGASVVFLEERRGNTATYPARGGEEKEKEEGDRVKWGLKGF